MNLAESWVGLRVVGILTLQCWMFTNTVQGGEKYQQAFYVFEELAQAAATSSVRTLVSQAVCEVHLGRLEEAQAALDQALQKDAEHADAIANLLVLNIISGIDATEQTEYVSPLSLQHTCLQPLGTSRRSALSINSWWTWRRRAPCSTRRRQSIAPRCRHNLA